MLEVWGYYRWRRTQFPTLSGWLHYLMLGASLLGIFGLFMLGASQMYFRISTPSGRATLSSVYLGVLLFFLVGFGWMEVWERFTDRYQFLARYCACIQAGLLMLVLASTVTISGESVPLYELLVRTPDSLWPRLYVLASIVLIAIYLTRADRSWWVAKLSGVSAPANLVMIFGILSSFEDRWDALGRGTMPLVLLLSFTAAFPQLYLALYRGKREQARSDLNG